ncbi:MAG: sulfatase/phosphatase domain-containing protein, partial [Planctomycetota bacterium]
NAESGPRGLAEGGPIGGPHSRVFLGMGWATLANTPFRRYKHFTHEGGIATPLIAHWPAGIAADRRGGIEPAPGHVIDVMPTLVEVCDATYPAKHRGHHILPCEGTSLVPAFAGQPIHRWKPIFWEHEGNKAIRSGRWKAVLKHGGPWELYDMEADRTELRDLATERTAVRDLLVNQWTEWAASSFVDPWPGPPRFEWGEEPKDRINPRQP